MKMYGRKRAAILATAPALALLAALAGCDKAPRAVDAPAKRPTPSGAGDLPPEIPVMGPEIPILALGDSLFAGYGLDRGESYPARLEAALRARGVNARVANAGVSGDTSADGAARLAFSLDSQPESPALVLVCLGGNDMLRGLDPGQTRRNLDAILTELDRRGIRVVLMGMLAPPNMGAQYRARFDPIYPALARRHGAMLVPFFLSAVIDKPDLLQADHIHPTARGIEEIVAATAGAVARGLPPAPSPSPAPAVRASG